MYSHSLEMPGRLRHLFDLEDGLMLYLPIPGPPVSTTLYRNICRSRVPGHPKTHNQDVTLTSTVMIIIYVIVFPGNFNSIKISEI